MSPRSCPCARLTRRGELPTLSLVKRVRQSEDTEACAVDGSVFDLSPAEKLQLVEDLWDDLAAAPDRVPVHDWQKAELVRRKANLARNPGTGLAWEEVKRRVRSRSGR